jgi:hypothetical protein
MEKRNFSQRRSAQEVIIADQKSYWAKTDMASSKAKGDAESRAYRKSLAAVGCTIITLVASLGTVGECFT